MVLSEAAGSHPGCCRWVRINPGCSHSIAAVLASSQHIILDCAGTHTAKADSHAYRAPNFPHSLPVCSEEDVLASQSCGFSAGNGLRQRKLSCAWADICIIVVQRDTESCLKSSVGWNTQQAPKGSKDAGKCTEQWDPSDPGWLLWDLEEGTPNPGLCGMMDSVGFRSLVVPCSGGFPLWSLCVCSGI